MKCKKNDISLSTKPRNSYFTLIRFDKPIYKPGDLVRFIVLVLDANTRPFEYNRMSVKILNEENISVQNFDVQRNSNYGVFSSNFSLSHALIEAKWEMRVQVDNGKKVSTSFLIAKETKKLIKIYIDGAEKITSRDTEIKLNVYAKYSSGNFYSGEAVVTAILMNEVNTEVTRSNKQLHLKKGNNELIFDVYSDLTLTQINQNFNVLVTVTVESSEATKNVEIIQGGKHYIVLEIPPFFTPGVSFRFNAQLYNINGMIADNVTKLVTAKATFGNVRNGDYAAAGYTRDGEVSLNISTNENATNMNLEVFIDEHKLLRTIEMDRSFYDELQIHASNIR